MYTTALLAAAELESYREMTFPRYRGRLGQPGLVAVGATLEGRPVGLGLAELPTYQAQAEVLSIFISPEHRGHGVGAALMLRLQQELAARGVPRVVLSFAADKPTTPFFERLLARCGWNPPQPHMYLGKTDRRVLEAPWVRRALPESLTAFPWHELTPQQRQAIMDRQTASSWYPPVLSPFVEEQLIDWQSSLGLRQGDEVLGWMVTHKVGQGVLRYSALFVDPGIRDRGCGVALCGASVLRQDWESLPYALFAVMVDNERMADAMRRHIAPYLLSLSETRQATRELDKA